MGCVTVAQHTYRYTLLLFEVALGKKFFKQKVRPLFDHVEFSGWNTDITGVHANFEQQLLIGEQLIFVVCFNKIVVVFASLYIVCLDQRLQLREIRGVLGHVSGQDHTYHPLT